MKNELKADNEQASNKSVKAIAKRKQNNPGESSDFPIVGIGASAGGLEALEQFFEHMPQNC